jgi:multidrug efflux system outer membrane protein
MMRSYRSEIVTVLLGAAVGGVVGGCTVGPNYKAPPTTVPPAYGSTTQPTAEASSRPSTQPTTQASTQPAIDFTQWWKSFNDPMLNKLVDQARIANWDLKQAEGRVREARAQRAAVVSAYYPQVNSSADVSRFRNSANSVTSNGVGGEHTLWEGGFDASWELDVFGGVRRGDEAATANIQASIADRNNVLVSLLGEVGRNYVELRGFQRQIAIAQDNVESQSESLDLTRAKFKAGIANDLDVAQAEAQVATTRSQIPLLETAAKQAIHQLGVLLGLPPEALLEELGQPQAIPAPPPTVPLGVPSELLRRRPDVMLAERSLAAATARIGVATADLFPRFTINGNVGLSASRFADLGNSSSAFWSIGPQVTWPVFNAGRIRAAIHIEEARTDQALASYEQTVLRALADVEDAMVTFENEQTRREILEQAVLSNRRAVDLSQQLYQRGLSPFLNVLEAQRALYLVEDQLVQSDTTVSSSAVALFKALGGGWETQQNEKVK